MDDQRMQSATERYARHHGKAVGRWLGSGREGSVRELVDKNGIVLSALKVHHREEAYCRERDCYLRLRDLAIYCVRGLNVPELIAFDDGCLAIEMTVVSRPFLLDFGSAYLDVPPDFPEGVIEQWKTDLAERFEADLPEVKRVIDRFADLGIFLTDLHPHNLSFR